MMGVMEGPMRLSRALLFCPDRRCSDIFRATEPMFHRILDYQIYGTRNQGKKQKLILLMLVFSLPFLIRTPTPKG